MTKSALLGYHQMAWQARLHPSSYRWWDQGSKWLWLENTSGSSIRRGARSEARMAYYAWYGRHSFSISDYCTNRLNLRCMHSSRLCPHRRSWWLRWLVLPLPRISLRYLRSCSQGTCSFEPWGSCIQLPYRRQSCDRLNQWIGLCNKKNRKEKKNL